ncbi:hypothetical protein BV20DRAFT_1053478 [Pilatotrama ljubarskyi]|nr:hypothetical protein BV20DRAFT_1053478 [Pilatotrama ljubarskyi]
MSNMDHLTTLPVELLSAIGKVANTTDLPSLLLANKHLNEVLTPTLYASITTFGQYQPGLPNHKCIRTLATDPSNLSFGRNLAILVQAFSFRCHHRVPIQSTDPEAMAVSTLVSLAIGRMASLKHFSFQGPYWMLPSICAALSGAAASTLQSLRIQSGVDRGAGPVDLRPIEGLRAAFTKLTSVGLAISRTPPDVPMFDFFRHVLISSSPHLETVSLLGPWPTSPPLSDIPALPRAVNLTLLDMAPSFASFPLTPCLRHLKIGWFPGQSNDSCYIPPDAFPNLEAVTCSYAVLPALLPADAPKPRPIRTVLLDHVFWDHMIGTMSSRWRQFANMPTWDEVAQALRCLSRSAGPVTILSFHARSLDTTDSWAGLGQSVRFLERLSVTISEWGATLSYHRFGDWGETLVAQAPRLHTFSFSSIAHRSDGPMALSSQNRQPDLELEWLQRWDKHTSVLKTVAFTNHFVWRKGANGWEESPRDRTAGW